MNIEHIINESFAMSLSSAVAEMKGNKEQETRIVIEMNSREVANGVFDDFMDVARRRGVNLSFK